jgi:TP901 family phage tail tape measure protein
MASFLPPTIAILQANISQFSAKMGEAREEMRTTEGSFAQAGALGKGMLLGIGAVAVGVGYESVKMAAGFDQAMEMVHTQAGASQQEVDKLKGSVLALAPAVGMGPEELATGLYHIESAGFRSAQAMDILTAASKLAVIGQSDFETTSQAVVGVMASQIKGVKDAADAGNLLNTTVGMGDMKMQQLAEAIGTGILPKAAAAGLSFEDVGSALATLTDNVTPANEAATRLGMTFSMMSAPTEKAKTAYEKIGMASNQLANDMRSKGMLGALQDLKAHLDATYPPSKKMTLSLQEQSQQLKTYSDSLTEMGVPLDQQTTMLAAFKKQLQQGGSAAVKQSEALSAMFGGGKSSGTMMTLLGEMDRLKEKTQSYGTAASRAKQAQEAWSAQQKQFSQQMREIGAQFESWGVKLGNVLIPKLQVFLGWVQTGAKWLSQHKVVLVALGVGLGALTTGLIAATIATIDWNASLLANPIVWIAAGIAAAVGLITFGIIELVKHWSTVWGEIKRVAEDVAHFLERVWNDVAGFTLRIWHDVTGALRTVWTGMRAAWDATGGKVVTWIRQAWDKLTKPITDEWNKITGDLSSIWQSLVTIWNATGGQLVSLISDGLGYVAGYFEDTWNGMVAVFQAVWDYISGIVSAALDVIGGVVRAGWDLVKGIFSTIWDLIIGVVKAAWDVISGAIKATLDFVGGVIKAGWDVVSGIFKTAWAVITGIVNTALDVIKGTLKIFADLVTGNWSKLWTDVKNFFSTIWDDIKKTFSTILDTIKKTVVDSAKNIWDGFTGAITNALTDIGKALTGVWNAIVGFFKDAGTWLWQAGKDIVNGLIGGVKAMFGAVAAAAGDLGDLVSKGFSAVIQNHSPSRVFHEFGRNIGQGLINGIVSMHGAVAGAAGGLGNAALGGFGAPGLGGMLSGSGIGGGVSSGGGVVVVVNVAGSVHSDAGVAKVVRQEVLRYQQRNSRTNLSLAGFGN